MLPYCSWFVVCANQEWINRKKWCINIWNLWYEEQKLKQSPWIESLHFSKFDYTVQMSSTTRSLCCRGCKTLQNGTPPPHHNQINALLILTMPYTLMPYLSPNQCHITVCAANGTTSRAFQRPFCSSFLHDPSNANLVHLPVTVPGSVYGLLLLCCFLACVSWVKFMDSFTCHLQNVG